VSLYVIWNVERNKWWKAGEHGYALNQGEVGHYSWDAAFKICTKANLLKVEDIIVPLEFFLTLGWK